MSFTNFLLISKLMPSSDVSELLPNIWLNKSSGTAPACAILHPGEKMLISNSDEQLRNIYTFPRQILMITDISFERGEKRGNKS